MRFEGIDLLRPVAIWVGERKYVPADEVAPTATYLGLSNCANCGTAAEWVLTEGAENFGRVRCRACFIQTASDLKEEAFRVWNTRPVSYNLDRAQQEDAERWRAFASSARFTMMGSANFDHSKWPEVSVKPNIHPGDGLHFGLGVWDRHPADDDEQAIHGRNLLMAYVEHRRKEIR